MGNNPNKDSVKMKNGGCKCGCVETNNSNHADPFKQGISTIKKKYKKGSIIPVTKTKKKTKQKKKAPAINPLSY